MGEDTSLDIPFTSSDTYTPDTTTTTTTTAADGSSSADNADGGSIWSDLITSAGGILTGAANLTNAVTGKAGSYTATGQYVPPGAKTTGNTVLVPAAKSNTLLYLGGGAAILLVLIFVFAHR